MRVSAYALLGNQVLSAALGVVYWILAARLYGVVIVGASSAAVSALLLIAGVADLGLSAGMVRFLPRAGDRTRRIIVLAYATSIVAAAVLSLVFVVFGGRLNFGGVLGFGALTALWVILAAVLRTLFRLQDAVLTGLKQAKWVLIENAIYNAAKIVILVAGVSYLGRAGIVGSWFIPLPLVVALCAWLIFGLYTRARPLSPAPTDSAALSLREIATSSGGDYVGSLVAEAASRLLPLVVIVVLGAAANAYFYQAWLVAATLGLLAGSMTDSFTAEAAGDRAHVGRYSRDILRQMAALILPAAAVIGVGAPLILTLFGTSYAAEGSALLRWLCLSTPLIVFNTWYLAYARVMSRIRQVVWLQSIGAFVLLAVGYVLLRPLGITGIGLAWVVSQVPITVIGLLNSRDVLALKPEASAL